ncbi:MULTISPECIES: helix-turn-helix domain-containing protein [unclassified Streptococcus]|uniref:helix-turn-helix domain-containing protein n=1 Tax=unclassified Streptococcus TaxID=2608887 RepID=UPI001D16979B|nr:MULTISPECIES: helix-turn-helix domain-containing protein [unclassified Streptococcus]MCQ9212566.1 helix-turn-helix domain-containing protein [Streptococcus sp. B01]MCQ9213905.1 helix-turn-helix domain-containing protein [Streptococcus sp. O1]
MDMSKNPFPQRLKELRKNAKLTQQELSNELNIKQGTYSRWERGLLEPNLAQITDLAIFFHVSVDYLTGKRDKEYSTISDFNHEPMSIEESSKIADYVISSIFTALSSAKERGISEATMVALLSELGFAQEAQTKLIKQLYETGALKQTDE